jgi:hypothetical protein
VQQCEAAHIAVRRRVIVLRCIMSRSCNRLPTVRRHGFCGQDGGSAVEDKGIFPKGAASLLFLLSFSADFEVDQKKLAIRAPAHYPWC